MAIIDDATQAQAEALGLAGRRAAQGLEPYTDGTANPGGRVGPYTPDQVDEYVETFLSAASDAGYIAAPPEGSAIVAGGDEVLVQGVAGTAVVNDAALSSVTLPGTAAVVEDADTFTVGGQTLTATVADNAPTFGFAATNAVLANAATVTLLPATGTTPAQGTGTAAVAANAVTGVRLAATSAVVTSGSAGTLGGQALTRTVAANAATYALPATAAVVANSSTVAVQNSAGAAIGTGTRTVAANAVSYVRLPATIAGVQSGTVTVTDAATGTSGATRTVASGVEGSIVLDGTSAIVTDTQVLAEAGGGTITLAIAAGVITATYTAP